MEVVILDSPDDVAAYAAAAICSQLQAKPNSTLGLATGNTPLLLYRKLVSLYERGQIDFSRVHTFNLDEYVGISPNNPQSYRSYMQRELFDHVNIENTCTHLPLLDSGQEYEALIDGLGGIDVQVLGIGENGHIGFNEPTSSLGSRTRVKTLTKSTLDANRSLFGENEQQPELAVTMGIATILESRRILLLATGLKKAQAIRNAVEGPLAAMCPASALQLHAKSTIILDEEAASRLDQADYYKWVHKQKMALSVAAV